MTGQKGDSGLRSLRREGGRKKKGLGEHEKGKKISGN